MGSSQPSVSVLVPFRSDHGHRDRLWNWCRPLWEATGYELVVEDSAPEHPFALAEAVNRCARRATGDVFVTMGADVVPNTAAIDLAVEYLTDFPWVQPFRRVCYITEASTEEIITTGDIGNPDVELVTEGAAGLMCVPRATWQDVGGYDERFVGWGPEDHAFVNVVSTLYGAGLALGNYAVHLWHPPALRNEANFDFYESVYVPAIGDPDRMRAVLSGRR